MDNPRSSSANGEDNVDMPDDLRCKRSDGKQWRCTAMSMPDKTVCEKHYIQAKRRAANSALRASLKKAKKKSAAAETSDGYLESKSGDEFDMPLSSIKAEDHSLSGSSKKKGPAGMRSFSEGQHSDEFERDVEDEENWRSYNNTPPLSTGDSPRSRSQRSFDAMPVMVCSLKLFQWCIHYTSLGLWKLSAFFFFRITLLEPRDRMKTLEGRHAINVRERIEAEYFGVLNVTREASVTIALLHGEYTFLSLMGNVIFLFSFAIVMK
ncbi:E3 ubiquitin-protein ligase JMJ24 [Linum perenne]